MRYKQSNCLKMSSSQQLRWNLTGKQKKKKGVEQGGGGGRSRKGQWNAGNMRYNDKYLKFEVLKKWATK